MRPLLVLIIMLLSSQCWAQPASKAEAATTAPKAEGTPPSSAPLTEEERIKLKVEELKRRRLDLLKQALKSTKSMSDGAKHIEEVLKESAKLLKQQQELLNAPLGEPNGR